MNNIRQRQTEIQTSLCGRLFEKLALKDFINDEKLSKRNVGTLSNLKVTQSNSDVALKKLKWLVLIENFTNPSFIHTFFGKLTKE
ncbi:hypothetical protein GALL_165790 [mine drainage metagenome]|uniref:Uncharacterized protein n=1 Tax=mine drainage metagenome TaxID=410659 RepID=A0A1J5S012_9ZZZZ